VVKGYCQVGTMCDWDGVCRFALFTNCTTMPQSCQTGEDYYKDPDIFLQRPGVRITTRQLAKCE
jgi:hypothetical protein